MSVRAAADEQELSSWESWNKSAPDRAEDSAECIVLLVDSPSKGRENSSSTMNLGGPFVGLSIRVPCTSFPAPLPITGTSCSSESGLPGESNTSMSLGQSGLVPLSAVVFRFPRTFSLPTQNPRPQDEFATVKASGKSHHDSGLLESDH